MPRELEASILQTFPQKSDQFYSSAEPHAADCGQLLQNLLQCCKLLHDGREAWLDSRDAQATGQVPMIAFQDFSSFISPSSKWSPQASQTWTHSGHHPKSYLYLESVPKPQAQDLQFNLRERIISRRQLSWNPGQKFSTGAREFYFRGWLVLVLSLSCLYPLLWKLLVIRRCAARQG